MLGYRSVCQNTAGLGLKNEGRQWPLNRGLFFPVVCLFEERSALERVVIGVVFFGMAEKWGNFNQYLSPMGVGSDVQKGGSR